jgi:glycosyltransferase involved in cell wall biosynthesis
VKPPESDVIVLQRVLRKEVADAIPFYQAQGCAVVVEIDDDFDALPVTNPAHAQTDPRRNPDYNRDHLRRACLNADLVTCTTAGLAKRYAPHGRFAVIPNYVRESWLKIRHYPPVPPRLGWTGVVMTHRGDLEVMGRAPAELCASHGWTFRAIGSSKTHERLGTTGETIPWADLLTDDYPMQIGQLSAAVVPLAETPFNRAKSWLKGIEYAACGVPFVASDVADYRKLAKRLRVPLARSPGDWRRELDRLMRDERYRSDTAHGNRAAMGAFTIEGNASQWWEAWERAYKRRANR